VLGRKDYTEEELEHGRAAVKQQLALFEKVVPAGDAAGPARDDFEVMFFNSMTLVLDRYYVHRIRAVAGKDTNPLNEVELITESLMSNGGIFQTNKVIKYVPENSVVKLNDGDPIRLTAKDFDRLSTAFFAELAERFGES